MAYVLVVLLLHLLPQNMFVLRIGRTARPVFLSLRGRYRISLQHRQSIFSVNISGVFSKAVRQERVTIFIKSLIDAREILRSALSSHAINPITEICRIYSSKIFLRPRDFTSSIDLHGNRIGNEGLLAAKGMVDG